MDINYETASAVYEIIIPVYRQACDYTWGCVCVCCNSEHIDKHKYQLVDMITSTSQEHPLSYSGKVYLFSKSFKVYNTLPYELMQENHNSAAF